MSENMSRATIFFFGCVTGVAIFTLGFILCHVNKKAIVYALEYQSEMQKVVNGE